MQKLSNGEAELKKSVAYKIKHVDCYLPFIKLWLTERRKLKTAFFFFNLSDISAANANNIYLFKGNIRSVRTSC